jgi:Tol biopolymer transport system component/DNA-binding winged helix-turn-helix (wHTH) protein
MLPRCATAARLRFGSFEFDGQAYELRKHGLKIKLPPQGFTVLACLLAHPGELVTREALFATLWPGGTHVEFEGNLNAVVRVLREALGDSARNPRFIETEPKLGYRFIAPVMVLTDVAEPEPPSPERHSPPQRIRASGRWIWGGVAIGLCVVAVSAAAWRGNRAPGPFRSNITQLTHFLGVAGHPTFSPDGTQIAFHWNGDERGDYDIYMMRLGSEDLRRITTNPANDRLPVWSPDGRDIAFLRDVSPTQTALILAPAIGIGERVITVLPRVRSLAWSPDGKWIAWSLAAPDNELNPSSAEGISAISLSTGEVVRITPGGMGDSSPAFSRDGGRLAFVRRSNLWVLDLDERLRVRRQPRQVTFDTRGPMDVVWTPDGASLIFSAERGAHGRLWRVAADGNSPPIVFGGENAYEPAIEPAGRRVVYSRSTLVDSLNAIQLCGAGCTPDPPHKLVYATKLARNPSFSPDGRRIAFESSRSGNMEIWVCGRDGANPVQLTQLAGPPAGTPNWSPDESQIVFDARLPGSAIFVIPSAGGSPRQLTSGGTEDLVPSWSRDGRRIYFASKRTG